MNQETERRSIAFIRTIGNRCSSCLRRSEENCRNCTSQWANTILHDLENERKPEVDYSLMARMLRIRRILERAAKPLLSSEIALDGICSNQLKQWTLKRMMRIGVIGRRLASRKQSGYCTYRYFLKQEKTKETKK